MTVIREEISNKWARILEKDVVAYKISEDTGFNTKLTFLGALEEYYEEISKDWKDEGTKLQYDRDYETVILPNMEGHNERTIDTYTIGDVDETIRRIIEKGRLDTRNNIYRPYADTTLKHFRRLISNVFLAAAEHEECANIFWDREDSLKNITSRKMARAIKKLSRSLTSEIEKRLFRRLYSDPATKRGQDILILLMWALGTRNTETCSLTFGDIKEMSCHPGNYTIIIYKHLEKGTNIVSTGGKTGNADREIPIPDKLMEFIIKRKKYVEKWLKENGYENVDINTLPIGCRGEDCRRVCSSYDLTAAACIVFRDIKLTPKTLSYVDAEITRLGNDVELSEREPTVYLLRRNLATTLLILGLLENEIEGIMGHDIVDMYETRNEFVYEDNLFRIKEKMEYRPLIGSRSFTEEIKLNKGEHHEYKNVACAKIKLPKEHGKIRIHIENIEPDDAINISSSGGIMKGSYYEDRCDPSLSRTVNITKKYQELYR